MVAWEESPLAVKSAWARCGSWDEAQRKERPMASVAPSSSVAGVPRPVADALRELAKFWWLWLVAGIFWIIAALVILQFDQASITTVGVPIGIMFLVSAAQQAFVGTLTRSGWKWVFYAFSVLFAAAGVISLIRPKNTFAG